PQRRAWRDGRLQQDLSIDSEGYAILPPFELVAVPLGGIDVKVHTVLADNPSQQPPCCPAREREGQGGGDQQRVESRGREYLRQEAIRSCLVYLRRRIRAVE